MFFSSFVRLFVRSYLYADLEWEQSTLKILNNFIKNNFKNYNLLYFLSFDIMYVCVCAHFEISAHLLGFFNCESPFKMHI